MTGELGIHGKVKPVGGVVAKVEAAFQAGATTVLIPKDNWQSLFEGLEGLSVIPVETVAEVFRHVFGPEAEKNLGFSTGGELFAPTPAPAPFCTRNPRRKAGRCRRASAACREWRSGGRLLLKRPLLVGVFM